MLAAPALAVTASQAAAGGWGPSGSTTTVTTAPTGRPTRPLFDRDRFLRACLAALLQQLRAHGAQSGASSSSGSITTTTTAPPATTTPTTVAPSPPASGPVPPASAAPSPTALVASVTPLVAPRTVGVGAAARAATGAPAAVTPPAVAPVPAPPQLGPFARTFSPTRSYGLLVVLTGVVLGFLFVQGWVDRRDPRIAHAPMDAHRDFRDFE